MSIQYLIDENLPPLDREQLLRYQPNLTVWVIGDLGVSSRSTLDSEILIWHETEGFILVTNNRASMPIHLAKHLTQNKHIPGIFVLRPGATIGEILEDLILIAKAGNPKDYQDRITHIPL